MTYLKTSAYVCLVLSAVLGSYSAKASGFRYKITDIKASPSDVVVVAGPRGAEYSSAGSPISKHKVSFILTISRNGVQEMASAYGGEMLPIFIYNKIQSPARLKGKSFRAESNTPLNALEDYRAFAAAGGRVLKPSESVLIELMARALANLENPNLTQVSGTYLEGILLHDLYRGPLLAHIASRVAILSNERVQIVGANGDAPAAGGVLLERTASARQAEPLFLVSGDTKYPIKLGWPNLVVGSLGFRPINVRELPTRPIENHPRTLRKMSHED